MKRNALKKAVLSIVSIAVLMTGLAGCSSKSTSGQSTNTFTQKDPKDYKGTINLWHFSDEFKKSGFLEQFNKVYPNIKVNVTVIPTDNNAYSTKLASVLASGAGAPDVFTSEVSFVNKFVNTPYYEDLSKAPYNAEDIAKNMVPYTVDLGRNQTDKSIRVLSWGATPGGIFYKRSLAKQYFGTDDPDQISKKFDTWEDLIQTGKDLSDKSNGKVKLLPNYSEMFNVASGSRTHAWVENNKLVIDDNIMKYIDYAKGIRDGGIDAKLADWSAPWSASMSGAVNGTNVFAYALPSWGLQYVLAANAPKTSGDWALAKAPAAYYSGGAWIGMYSKSKNKELAWQLVKFMASSDFQTWLGKKNGDFVSNLDSIKEIANSAEGNNTFAGGQNITKVYNEIVPSITGKLVTKYDETINNKFNSDLDLYISGKASKDAFLTQFKNDVKTAFPDITVE